MLTDKEFNAIFDYFAKCAGNENAPIFKPFNSGGGHWCISTDRTSGVVYWYERNANGEIIKCYDNLPENCR